MSLRYEELRLDFEKKQKEIAEILDVKTNTYSKWENEINDMPIEKAIVLSNYYKVSLDYMLGLANKKNNVSNYSDVDWDVFKERLKYIRHNQNLSQSELSLKLGFAQTTYSHYEIGDRKPTTLKVLVIAQYFDVSVDYLVGRTNNSKIYK